MNAELIAFTPLILAGEGYQLTIAPDAEVLKAELLELSAAVQYVTSNDESGQASHATRKLAALRIEVEKSRKLVKEPVNRIGKMIDQAAKDFLSEIDAEETRIKQLIGVHATEVARIKAEKEAEERKAFEDAKAAKEAVQETASIGAVLAEKKALAAKLAASNEVAATRIADGVRFAWDFEVHDIEAVFSACPGLVKLEIRRAEMLAWLKSQEEGGFSTELPGIRAFKKPVVSSR